MNYETRTTELTIMPSGEPIFSEMATAIKIVNEGGGDFVEVIQSGRNDLGKIVIGTDEWPPLRSAIDSMIQECGAEFSNPKTCKTCKFWRETLKLDGHGHCGKDEIRTFHEPSDSEVWLTPPANFGCNRWETK